MCRFVWLVFAGMALFAAPGAAQIASKCASAQYKAAGKSVQALARCKAKAVAKGVPLDLDCVDRVWNTLHDALVRAHRKGDCIATGIPAGAAEDYLATVTAFFETPARCCAQLAKDSCLYVHDPIACEGIPGILGEPGSVCDGASGDCVAPPAAPGPCCADPLLTISCGGGDVDAQLCSDAGATFSPSARCTSIGECEAP
jgi:hypothetical protein